MIIVKENIQGFSYLHNHENEEPVKIPFHNPSIKYCFTPENWSAQDFVIAFTKANFKKSQALPSQA